MATPGMSWQQHHYGGSAAKFVPSQQAGHSLDYSPDLHLKMSKKIAQLTKVRGAGASGWGCLGGAASGDLPPGPFKLGWDAGGGGLQEAAGRHPGGAPPPRGDQPAQNDSGSPACLPRPPVPLVLLACLCQARQCAPPNEALSPDLTRNLRD